MLGTIFSICVTGLWVMVVVGTVKKAIWGELIFAPCLKDLEGAEREAKEHFEKRGKEEEREKNSKGNDIDGNESINGDGDVQKRTGCPLGNNLSPV